MQQRQLDNMDFNIYSIDKGGSIFFRKYFIYLNNQKVYTIERNSFFDSSYSLWDSEEVPLTIRKSSLFGFAFQIRHDNQVVAKVGKTPFSNIININSSMGEMHIEGNLFKTSFTLFHQNEEIGKISRNKFSANNYMNIALRTEYDQKVLLAALFILEILIRRRKKRR